MFAKRIIPCLDCKDGRVVKGIQFVNLRDAGDPGELAEAYNREGADELVMLDISASREGRATLMDTVHRVARRLFIPLTVGGGVRTVEDAHRLLSAGADKVAVNTGAVESPEIVNRIAEHFGRQALVVAIDARRRVGANLVGAQTGPEAGSFQARSPTRGAPTSRWTVSTYGGTKLIDLDAVDWALEVEARGAGEILLTSMDADGTQAGFDCELTKTIADALHIPVIASGGAGGLEHFAEVFLNGHADAALAASIFHFETHTLRSLKEYLQSQGVPVRL
ncbi:imidazole glycerol phosphate synthase, catalytic subunit with HisH [Acidobacteriia bacterium SbA2]|nr:imidazole glycerol phosphate synthase, catalytic subunit with HisH [Acidobacteriia bacterium SbA2]